MCLCVRVCVREKIVSEFSLKKNQTDISESTAESASACLLCASHTSSICRWRTSTLLQMLCYSLIMDYRQLLSILTMCGQPLPAFWSLRSAGYIKHKQKSATPLMGSIEWSGVTCGQTCLAFGCVSLVIVFIVLLDSLILRNWEDLVMGWFASQMKWRLGSLELILPLYFHLAFAFF